MVLVDEFVISPIRCDGVTVETFIILFIGVVGASVVLVCTAGTTSVEVVAGSTDE